jgi:hypothetical protein
MALATAGSTCPFQSEDPCSLDIQYSHKNQFKARYYADIELIFLFLAIVND